MDIASLAFRTFVHATENEGRVEQALRFVSGAEELSRNKSEGYHGNPITILEARVTNAKPVKRFLASLDGKDVASMLDSLERRVDEDSFFFLRLDKQAAYDERFVLADHDDVISVRGKIKSYPQSRENALRVLEGILRELLEPRPHKD